MPLSFANAGACATHLMGEMSHLRHGTDMVDNLYNEFKAAASAIMRVPVKMQLLRDYSSISMPDTLNGNDFLWLGFTDCISKRASLDMTKQPHHINIKMLGDLCVYMGWNLDNYDMIMEEFPREQYSKISSHLREAYIPAVRGFLNLSDEQLGARSVELVADRARGIDILLPIPAEKWHKSI